MPNGEHGLMPGAMLVDAHSGGQEVAGGLYTVQSGVQTNTNGIVEHRTHKPAPPFQVGSSSSDSQTTYVMHTRLAVRNHQAIGVQAQLRHRKQRHDRQELTSTAGQSEQLRRREDVSKSFDAWNACFSSSAHCQRVSFLSNLYRGARTVDKSGRNLP